MLRLGLYLALLISYSVSAQTATTEASSSDYKNLFQISADGFGWSSSSADAEANDGVTSANYETTNSELVINYARKLSPQFWLQGFLSVENNEIDYEDNTAFSDTEDTDTGFSIGGIYDFSENTVNSFFINASLGVFNAEAKNGTSKVEADFKAFSIGGGKRWSLAPMGLPNASYTLALNYVSGSGDLDDNGTEVDLDIDGLTLEIIQLDLFF